MAWDTYCPAANLAEHTGETVTCCGLIIEDRLHQLSLVSLAALGAFGGYLGGAPLGRASLRVTLGGALTMAVTALIGRILGVSVG